MATVLKKEIQTILDRSRPHGWVLEPDAKRILKISGIPVPNFHRVQTADEAIASATTIGYPVVAKLVSPAVIHKSEAKGVAVGIRSDRQIKSTFERFAKEKAFAGMLVEEQGAGLELIVGGKIDAQFGPVVLLGIGGTSVEIYKDTALRMAPINAGDVTSMINCLTAGQLLRGFRGDAAVDINALVGLMVNFSGLLMKLADQITSIDLNPVLCSPDGCLVADARIMLPK
ncbi:MAG: acetate--CoA ligase family protein [Desulfobacteraceae bacterium]|jgi:succinyl-CoA synthetase beta subunit